MVSGIQICRANNIHPLGFVNGALEAAREGLHDDYDRNSAK